MKAILLDRDGTLIDVVRDEETGTISTAFHPDHLRLLPEALEGLHLLRDAGYAFAIATNQPGPAKGHYSIEAVARTNQALVAMLAREGIEVIGVAACHHHPQGAPGGDSSLIGPCSCRKPLPGLLEQLIGEHGFDRASSWMVGDSAGDVEAGHAAGLKTALLFPSNRCELCPLRPGFGEVLKERSLPTVHAATLAKAARLILAHA